MIDLEQKLRRYMKPIKTYILDQVNTYFNSPCRRKLKTRIDRLDDSIDMRFAKNKNLSQPKNHWMSKTVIPLVREAFLARRAVTFASFQHDPIVVVHPTGNTPTWKARNLQDALNQNFKATKFRNKAWRRIVNASSRWGPCPVVSTFVKSSEVNTVTQMGAFGRERVTVTTPKNNVVNRDIHPLNYFQDPQVPDPDDASFRGYIERVRLSEVVAEVQRNPNAYLKDQVNDMVRESKKSFGTDEHYYNMSGSEVPMNYIGVDRVHFWGLVHIKGNETSEVKYYAQMIGNHLIRFEANRIDYNLTPISLFNFDQRLEYWWGNVDTENVMPQQNLMHTLMNMAYDDGMRKLERLIFYDEGKLDTADINNRHKNGGFIPMRTDGRAAREFFTEFQGSSGDNLSSLQYMMAEAKESASRVSPKGDFARKGLQGGPRNDTATAAMIMDDQADVLESDLLRSFSYGLIDLGMANSVLMQQFLPDVFVVRPDPRLDPREIGIEDIIGTYDFEYSTALTKNKQVQAQNLMNWITLVQNMRNTGDPAWLNVNAPAMVKEMFRKLDLGINLDELYPDPSENPAAQNPAIQNPMVPGMGNQTIQALPPMPDVAMPAPGDSQPIPQEAALA